MKVVTVIGARPQFIKASAVSRALAARQVTEVLVTTGQHYDPGMSSSFLDELGLPPPAYNLKVGSGQHGAQTGRMLQEVEKVLLMESPDWVLVFGDTNSTLAGALAAAKLAQPVAHVEAGLRSFNRLMPEELNRVVTDHLSTVLFAPTIAAMENLEREGLGPRSLLVGDVMYDVVLQQRRRADERSQILADLDLEAGNYVLATIHRAENTDDPARLRTVLLALVRVAEKLPVILPLHPRTRKVLGATSYRAEVLGALNVVEPIGYLDMVKLVSQAAVVVTDSGGVQKEAFFHGVACVTVRDETEWVELIDSGWNRLAPPVDPAEMVTQIMAAIGSRGRDVHPYGNGRAADLIVDALLGRAP